MLHKMTPKFNARRSAPALRIVDRFKCCNYQQVTGLCLRSGLLYNRRILDITGGSACSKIVIDEYQ